MNLQITSDEFIKDGDLRQRCKRIVESDDFQLLIKAAYSRLGPYRLSLDFSQDRHVQDRIDGGRQAVFAFVKELMTLPYKENAYPEKDLNQFIDPMEALDSTLV
jgi:hypothetical protein